ncbi:unnamed protein product [Mytilus coruscus]|uniref:B box-type domain-containing protein n=1 Tax=Mytilus coruscus TaxID=42192 RepID=A0A6J8D8Z9_MYTCO|nr:unnamed protein product [Mytilus coruscus]
MLEMSSGDEQHNKQNKEEGGPQIRPAVKEDLEGIQLPDEQQPRPSALNKKKEEPKTASLMQLAPTGKGRHKFGPESAELKKTVLQVKQQKGHVEKMDTSGPATQSQTPKEIVERISENIWRAHHHMHRFADVGVPHPDGTTNKNESIISTAQTSTNSCVFCDNKGVFYCYDCKLAFCKPCRDNHDKLPQSKTHSVTDLKSVNPSAVKLRCELHKSEYTFYCTPCNTLVCNICVTSDHKEHGMSGIIEKSDELKRLAKSKLSDMKSKLQKLSKVAEKTKMVHIPQLDDESEMAVAKIRSIENDVHKLISTKADIKVNEVQDVTQWKKEELQNAWKNKERIYRKQTSIYESLETLLSEEHAVSFLVSYQTLKRDMCDLNSEVKDDIEPHHIQAPDLKGFLDETIHSLQDYRKRLE